MTTCLLFKGMNRHALQAWKSANAEVCAKFKENLKRQLAQPYHQTILELGDEDAEPLRSVLANLTAITSKEGIHLQS